MEAARRPWSRPWVWVALFAGYAVLAALLRLTYRDSVIADDAESFLWARSLAWGYGPQPPLYAWLHWAVFQVLGETALASAVTHAIAQFTVPVGAFLLARRFAPVALAGAATLAIFIVPEVGRAFPVTRTHNILATALTPLVVLTFLIWLERQGRGRALLFGAVAALAILAKATATLVFASLLIAAVLSLETRVRIRPAQLALAIGAMVTILFLPGLWLWQNADVGTASLVKFRTEDGALTAFTGLATGCWPPGDRPPSSLRSPGC
jgi:4-amino-4-deoxy-L-arabinose transferase-like glycosyltransferase